jgi:hypothetical protein
MEFPSQLPGAINLEAVSMEEQLLALMRGTRAGEHIYTGCVARRVDMAKAI